MEKVICPKCHEIYEVQNKILNSRVFCTVCEFVFDTPKNLLERWFVQKTISTRNFSLLWLLFSGILGVMILTRSHFLTINPKINQFFLYSGQKSEILKNYILKKNKEDYTIFTNNYFSTLVLRLQEENHIFNIVLEKNSSYEHKGFVDLLDISKYKNN